MGILALNTGPIRLTKKHEVLLVTSGRQRTGADTLTEESRRLSPRKKITKILNLEPGSQPRMEAGGSAKGEHVRVWNLNLHCSGGKRILSQEINMKFSPYTTEQKHSGGRELNPEKSTPIKSELTI